MLRRPIICLDARMSPGFLRYEIYSSTVLYMGLWVSLSNPPLLAPGLLGHSANGVCSNLAPRVRQTFFLHQILRKPTNCVVCQRFERIQTGPIKSRFDRLFDNPLYRVSRVSLSNPSGWSDGFSATQRTGSAPATEREFDRLFSVTKI